jgi:hypothetical protein
MRLQEKNFMNARILMGIVLIFAVQNVGGQIAEPIKSPTVSTDRATNESVSSDELAVYAAILDSLSQLNANSHLLISDKTSTFSCGESTGNGLSIAGCNGLRNSTETPSDRMAIVARDLPDLQKDTLREFLNANQQYVSIAHRISSSADYYIFNDREIPKDWKYSFLVYLSRVGFNHEHTEALVNVGGFSYADSNLSEGHYVVLRKLAGKWKLGGTSVVWKLAGN